MSDQAGLGSLVEEIRQASDSIADAKNARRLEPIAPASFFRSTLTCSGTPAATPWPMLATTRDASRIGSTIDQSSTQRATRR
jgi:hypothetical protein